jgi:hypothetical protein
METQFYPMERFNHSENYNFRKVYRWHKDEFKLTFQQFFFFLYLYQCGFDKFRACKVQVPGLSNRCCLYFLMRLKQWGYLSRNEKKVFSWTEIAKERYKKFEQAYNRTCSRPFKW